MTKTTTRIAAHENSAFIAAQGTGGCPAPDPIFIVGLPRAGSTLVEQILSSHSLVEGTLGVDPSYLLDNDAPFGPRHVVDNIAGTPERELWTMRIDPAVYREALVVHRPALQALYAAAFEFEVDGVRVLKPETVDRARAEQSSGPDEILKKFTRFGLGFMLDGPDVPLLTPAGRA